MNGHSGAGTVAQGLRWRQAEAAVRRRGEWL